MASGGLSSISAGVEHGRARGGMEELRGEVAQLGVRQIEVGRRGLAGATSDGDFTRFCPLELDLAPRKENGERNGKLRGVHEDKSADAEVGHDCRRVERRRRAQSPVWPASAQCRAVDTLFLRLKDFSSILTS